MMVITPTDHWDTDEGSERTASSDLAPAPAPPGRRRAGRNVASPRLRRATASASSWSAPEPALVEVGAAEALRSRLSEM
jgi:hypothetical protein